jgi:cation transport regulator
VICLQVNRMPKELSREGLPEAVKENLPKHAREIYQKAHDNALEQYKDPKKRRGNASLEETAHRVAWAAVEQVYRKDSLGKWVKK